MGQMVMDPETGELMEEETLKDLYTETSISGKALLTERCKLGEYVKVEVTCQVVQVGEAIDAKGARSKFQKVAVMSVTDFKRGAI